VEPEKEPEVPAGQKLRRHGYIYLVLVEFKNEIIVRPTVQTL
jgi:hypothetical protein